MSTTTNDVLGIVHPDGTLELADKLTLAPGRVRVHVESVEPAPQPSEGLIEFLDRTQRELEVAGHRFMTDEEVTAWVEELRSDDDRIENAYREMQSE